MTSVSTTAVPIDDAALKSSVGAATRGLLDLKQPDGHFVFELEADATIPSEYVLLRHYLAEPVDAALEAKIAVYLRRIQGAHGGWPLVHDGPFDMSASVKAYFALKMIGDDIDAPHMVRAPSGGRTDRPQIRQAVDQDRAAELFHQIVVPHLADGLALARWLAGNASDAEDIVQDACMRALRGLDGYRGGSARAWMLTIVRNTSYTWMSRNRPRAMMAVGDLGDLDDMAAAHGSSLPDEDGPEASLIARADTAALEAAIAALPQPFRETLVLRDINGLSYREISAMLAVPIGTVMSRLARARGLLASELGRAS